MHLTSVKNAKDTGLAGVEFIFTDKAITEIVIGKVRIRKSESYGQQLAVYVETPHITETRYRVTAKLDGFPDAISYHDQKYTADTAASELRDRGAVADVDEVKALIDENGQIVGTVGEAPAAADTSNVPF